MTPPRSERFSAVVLAWLANTCLGAAIGTAWLSGLPLWTSARSALFVHAALLSNTAMLALVPAAVLAGAGVAVGNGLVDLDRDAPVGKGTIAVRIGRDRAWVAHAGAFATAIAIAVLLAPSGSASTGAEILGDVRRAGIPLGAAAIAVGAGLLSRRRAHQRERGWELESIGTAALGLGWLAGLAATNGGGVGS